MTSRSHPTFARRPPGVLAIALAAVMSLTATAPKAVSVGALNADEVKAALLYNFAKFVDWPADAFAAPDSPFVIGVLGSDPLSSSLERLLIGKTVGSRPIVIHRWGRARERGPCQMLFVTSSERPRLKQLLHDLDRQPVLTVADMSEFAAQGGMIGLVVEDNRLGFEINTDGADRARLKISSRLLSLARVISPGH